MAAAMIVGCSGSSAVGPAPTVNQSNGESLPPLKWYKGNLHAHTLQSDGDSPPSVVAKWYLDHGYDFLVFSDHNVRTDRRLVTLPADAPPFLMIESEEISAVVGDKQVHVNALGLGRTVAVPAGSTSLSILQANIDAATAVGGLSIVAHPNFTAALEYSDLDAAKGYSLLEVWNGHGDARNAGGPGRLAVDSLWDRLLTSGRRVYGVAVDDAHRFIPPTSEPGLAWVVVRARSLDERSILSALAEGNFYASNGVALADLSASASQIALRISPEPATTYTTAFIGSGGRVLASRVGTNPVFDLPPSVSNLPGYVRAVVTNSRGRQAWVQPVFLPASSAAR